MPSITIDLSDYHNNCATHGKNAAGGLVIAQLLNQLSKQHSCGMTSNKKQLAISSASLTVLEATIEQRCNMGKVEQARAYYRTQQRIWGEMLKADPALLFPTEYLAEFRELEGEAA